MSKSQRTKGAAYERDIANQLTDQLGQIVRRNIGQSRDGGDDITVGRFRIECKRRARIATYEFMDQCTKSCDPDDVPVVVMRGDGRDSLVVMRFDDWIKLAREEMIK